MTLYGLLLRIYPPAFRRRFGGEMREDFQAQLRRTRRSSGWVGSVALWVRTALDMLVSGLTERAIGWSEQGREGRMRGMETLVTGAVRRLRRAPGYAMAFVLTLGLAIGVNSAVFSVVNGVILSPLPFEGADRILFLKQPATAAGIDNATFSFMEIDDFRAASTTVDEFVEYGDWEFTVMADASPHRAVGGLVTSNFFEVLGMRPAHGRLLTSVDDADGAEPTMLLTWAYWQRVHGGDPAVVGRTVELENLFEPFVSVRIVGVLEPGLHYTGSRRPDFYVNYASNDHYQDAAMRDSRTHRMTDLFARVAPGSNAAAARAELASIAATLHQEFPDAYPTEMGYGLEAVPWEAELSSGGRSIFLALLGTVALVLLLAAFNVANLVLTRLIRAQRDLRTRVALGASARDLRLELTAENALLGLAGGLLGIAFAFASRDALASYAGRFTVRAQEISVDPTVLGVTLAGAVGVAVALAWMPGLPVAPGTEGGAALSGRVTDSRWRKRLQRGLVVGQLALSFALLNGSALLVRSMMELAAVDPGFETERIVAMRAPTGPSGEPLPMLDQTAGWSAALAEIEAFPGVERVATARWAPLGRVTPTAIGVRLDDGGEEIRRHRTAANNVTPSFFEMLGIELRAGRLFDASDDRASAPVVVLSESMARAYFGADDPIGRTIRFTPDYDQIFFDHEYEIVGVVADVHDHGLGHDEVHTFYRPAAQNGFGPEIMVATRGEASGVAAHVREVVQRMDPSRAVEEAEALTLRVERAQAPSRLNAVLFGGFALLALVIAAVGVLATLAFSVSQRVREFAIRIALGADRGEVLGTVLTEGVLLVVAALAVGALATLGLGRFLAGLLFGVEPLDPISMLGAALLLGSVAVGASLMPALRATRTHPSEVLRGE